MSKEIKTTDLGIAFPERTASGIVRKSVVLGKESGFSLNPNPDYRIRIPKELPVFADVHSEFTLRGFERPREPYAIGKTVLEVPLGTEFFGLPIKFPGTEYRVPEEISYAKDILEQATTIEQQVNPHINGYYSYLSLYNTYVEKGARQLTAGLHSDGIQGRRIVPKVPIEHGFAFANEDPTDFFPQKFDMNDVDVGRHLLDAVFESQVDRKKIVNFHSSTLIFLDAYCVHQAVPASRSGFRTFMKLMFTPRQYDRKGNAINLHFQEDYERERWNFQPRPIPGDLTIPDHIKKRIIFTAE